MRVGEYVECDGTRLAKLISTREVGADEVREAALAAIEQVEPELNATVHGPFEDAEAGPGPFAGVPFAAKDTLFEQGRPCEFGSRLLAGFLAPISSTLAERFQGAGLLTLARTNLPEFAFSFDTAPVAHGATRNPWALDRSPGGSSGGAAALVAARALPIAHANDGGGSIRIPAAWCGLVGLKPSRGRVPSGPFMGESPGGIAHEFVVTRSVRDAARLLDAIAGPSPGDRYYVAAPERPFAAAMGADPGRLRVAVHTEPFWGRPTDPETAAAVDRVGRVLEDLGHVVEPARAAVDADGFAHVHLVLWSWLLGNIAGPLGALLGREPGPETVEAASLACLRHATTLTAGDITRAYAVQNAASRAWGAFLDEYDLFLCPTTGVATTPSGIPAQDDARFTTAEAWMQELFSYISFTPVANTTGQPAISLPLGTAADGLPIGVMLTAQALREDLLLGVAAQLEQALPWDARRPAICAG